MSSSALGLLTFRDMSNQKPDEPGQPPEAQPSKHERHGPGVRDAEEQELEERERERQGNRGPEQEPGFGQGA